METKKKEIEAYKARCDKMTNDELKQEIIKLEKEKKEIKNNIATKTARIKILELEIKNAKKAEPVEKPVNKVEKKKPVKVIKSKAKTPSKSDDLDGLDLDDLDS